MVLNMIYLMSRNICNRNTNNRILEHLCEVEKSSIVPIGQIIITFNEGLLYFRHPFQCFPHENLIFLMTLWSVRYYHQFYFTDEESEMQKVDHTLYTVIDPFPWKRIIAPCPLTSDSLILPMVGIYFFAHWYHHLSQWSVRRRETCQVNFQKMKQSQSSHRPGGDSHIRPSTGSLGT